MEESRARLSAQPVRRLGCGAASVLLHAAAIGAVAMMVSPPLPPVAPDETVVEMVFEKPAVPPEVRPEPLPVPPAPTPPQAETPPPPEPEPAPVVVPPRPLPKVTPPPPALAPKSRPARPVLAAPVARPAPQVPPVPPPSVPVPAATVAAVVDPAWQASVSAWLAARKTYPEEARRRGEEGRVTVRFTVDRSGRVVVAAIVSASGSALLDEAALGLLRQAVLPAFPATMAEGKVTITTTVRYSLR